MTTIAERRNGKSGVAVRKAPCPAVPTMEAVELRAWEDHVRAARGIGLAGMELVRTGQGGVLFSPGVATPAMNRAFGPTGRPLAASLPEAYGARGISRFLLQVTDGAGDEPTRGALTTMGYRPYDRWVRLHREAGDVPWVLTSLDVVRAGPEHAEAFGRICQRAFDLPPSLAPWIATLVGRPGWEAFVALDGERPVATAAYHVQGEWAWMGWSATLPSERGRGAQLALVGEMAIRAERSGCRHFTAEAPEDRPGHPGPTFRNALRLGFRPVSRRVSWLWEAA
ncbi:MAG: GNAT family N-acetyltransferase [Gemmatimonadota bacterium]